MMIAKRFHYHRLRAILLACIGTLGLLTGTAIQAEAAAARLRQDQANSVVLEITLDRPAPANLIAEVFCSSSTQIVSAVPKPAKIDRNKGVVRWLLKDTRPGTQVLRIGSNQPLSLSACNAHIRYRQPGSGEMIEITASR